MLNENLNGFEGKTVVRNIQTKSGLRFPAGLAIVVIGTEPNLQLVTNTPLSSPGGCPVNEYLESDEKGIYAVGDIALYPGQIVRRSSPCDQLGHGLSPGGDGWSKHDWTKAAEARGCTTGFSRGLGDAIHVRRRFFSPSSVGRNRRFSRKRQFHHALSARRTFGRRGSLQP